MTTLDTTNATATGSETSSPAVAPAGPHTEKLWQGVADIRERIDNLPFLIQLGDGSLEPEKFAFYIAQDSHYLNLYKKALALLGARSEGSEDLQFWTESAGVVVSVELEMHQSFATDPILREFMQNGLGPRSVQTAAYSEFLLAQAALAPYAVAVAAVLPCYWIYAESGARVARAAGFSENVPAEHPYATWVAAYADESFHASVRRAIDIVERALERATEAEREAAFEAFRAATRFEELFWLQAQDAPADRTLI
ncbi:MAG: TenA family protein [Microbacteriaceae bacterium]|nr:TenA family protein [Microbacteriaceae bacterium]